MCVYGIDACPFCFWIRLRFALFSPGGGAQPFHASESETESGRTLLYYLLRLLLVL